MGLFCIFLLVILICFCATSFYELYSTDVDLYGSVGLTLAWVFANVPIFKPIFYRSLQLRMKMRQAVHSQVKRLSVMDRGQSTDQISPPRIEARVSLRPSDGSM